MTQHNKNKYIISGKLNQKKEISKFSKKYN